MIPAPENIIAAPKADPGRNAQPLALVSFPDSEQAFDALKALEASSGPIVHGSVVVTKDLSGNLFLHETTKEEIGGMTAGAFCGGLAGLRPARLKASRCWVHLVAALG